jgi:8-oxo-dGTP diphosphatase
LRGWASRGIKLSFSGGFQLRGWSGYTGFVTEEQPESEAKLVETDRKPPAGNGMGSEAGESGAAAVNGARQPALRLVAAALMLRGDEVLICQRRPDQPMALQWEFPGGKIEPGESPEIALARELDEELGIAATIGPRVTHIRHNYRHGGAVDLQFFAVYEFRGEIENRIFKDVRWVKLEELTKYDFLAADRGLIRDLAQGKLL